MNRCRSAPIVAAFLGAACACRALGPHEVALLVNGRSPRSLAVANHFAALRGIPEANIVFLDLPDSVLEPRARISPADFTRSIWTPTLRALKDRGIADHVLAWVYSVDFPVAVDSRPVLSLQGITFLRNKVPDEKSAREGSYVSPLFFGPEKPNEAAPPGFTLESLKAIWREEMPLPSMTLGFMGARGNEYEKVLECLRAGARSDGTRPAGYVAFVVNQDVRSKCRHWQYPGAVRDLAARGVAARIVEDPRQIPPSLIGLMLGVPWIPSFSSTFLPGAVCDHLTSFAAVFDHYDQTKLTSWIHFGATASDGTVLEPCALWTKFPSACFFMHYANGGTLIESFFLSIRCPLEILLVGEPLAAPWKKPGSVALGPPRTDGKSATLVFEVSLQGWTQAGMYEVLLDGKRTDRQVENGLVKISPGELSEGFHTLRVVALSAGRMKQQIFGETEFSVHRLGRSVGLSGLNDGGTVSLHRPLTLQVIAKGKPREVGILSGTRWLARGAPGDALIVDPAEAGLGPVTWRPVALYADGDPVRGPAMHVTVEADYTPPACEISTVERPKGRLVLSPVAADNRTKNVLFTWLQPLTWPADGSEGPFGKLGGSPGVLRVSDESVTLETTNHCDVAFFGLTGWPAIADFEAEIKSHMEKSRVWRTQKAGLVFNYRNGRNFDFWGLLGDRSAWAFGTCRNGVIEPAVARGAFIRSERWHRIAVRQTPGGLAGYVNDELVCRWKGAALNRKNPLGFMAGGETAQFRSMAVGPPCAPEKTFALEGDSLVVLRPDSVRGLSVTLKADNGGGRARKAVLLTPPTP